MTQFSFPPRSTRGAVLGFTWAQIGTVVYFLFFLLMPWYSRMDKCRPEPERVTSK